MCIIHTLELIYIKFHFNPFQTIAPLLYPVKTIAPLLYPPRFFDVFRGHRKRTLQMFSRSSNISFPAAKNTFNFTLNNVFKIYDENISIRSLHLSQSLNYSVFINFENILACWFIPFAYSFSIIKSWVQYIFAPLCNTSYRTQPETYLEPYQTSMMELFSKNSLRLSAFLWQSG